MAIVDANMLSEVNSVVKSLPSAKNSGQYHCHICSKVYLSESGFAYQNQERSNEESRKLKCNLDMFFLKSFVVKSAAKLAEDVCYPEDVMGEFKNFEISSVDHILPAYNLMLPIIKSFSGDPEKFYPQFYKTFSSAETIYKSLCGNCSLLLSFVVTNHVLALLTGVTIQEDVLTYDTDEVQNLSEKDLSLISYLGGCFWNIYRRICCSTKNTGLYSQQCLSFLMDGKYVGENVTLPEHRHVNIMDRAGLWKLNENIKSI